MSLIQTNRSFLGTANGSRVEKGDAEASVRNAYGIQAENLTPRSKECQKVVLDKIANIRREFMLKWSLRRCNRKTHAGLAKLAGLVIGNILTAGFMSAIATLICRIQEARAFSSSGAQKALNMLGQAALTYDIAQQTNNTIAKNRKHLAGNDVDNLIAAIRILCANEDGFLDGEKVAQFMSIVDFEDNSQNARNIEDFGAQVEEVEESYGSSSIFNQSAVNELKEAVFKKTFKAVVAAHLVQQGSSLPEQEAVREAIEKYYTQITGRAVLSEEPEGECEAGINSNDFDDEAADFMSALREQLSSAQRTPSHQASPMQPLVDRIVTSTQTLGRGKGFDEEFREMVAAKLASRARALRTENDIRSAITEVYTTAYHQEEPSHIDDLVRDFTDSLKAALMASDPQLSPAMKRLTEKIAAPSQRRREALDELEVVVQEQIAKTNDTCRSSAANHSALHSEFQEATKALLAEIQKREVALTNATAPKFQDESVKATNRPVEAALQRFQQALEAIAEAAKQFNVDHEALRDDVETSVHIAASKVSTAHVAAQASRAWNASLLGEEVANRVFNEECNTQHFDVGHQLTRIQQQTYFPFYAGNVHIASLHRAFSSEHEDLDLFKNSRLLQLQDPYTQCKASLRQIMSAAPLQKRLQNRREAVNKLESVVQEQIAQTNDTCRSSAARYYALYSEFHGATEALLAEIQKREDALTNATEPKFQSQSVEATNRPVEAALERFQQARKAIAKAAKQFDVDHEALRDNMERSIQTAAGNVSSASVAVNDCHARGAHLLGKEVTDLVTDEDVNTENFDVGHQLTRIHQQTQQTQIRFYRAGAYIAALEHTLSSENERLELFESSELLQLQDPHRQCNAIINQINAMKDHHTDRLLSFVEDMQ